MLALERRNSILEKLMENKKVVVSELSQLYGVSEETIRRDLEKLEKDGLCTKSYGGAIIKENDNIDLPFNVRKKSNVEGKQKIAELIASIVKNGEHIMLDASSTAVFIAKALKAKERLTVVTNSIEIIIELSDVSDWNVISVGGSLKEGYLALVGAKTAEHIKEYRVEKTILSAKAFSIRDGFSDSMEDLAFVKEMMVKNGNHIILAVDSTKFGKYAFAKFAQLPDVHTIVTDKKPETEVLEMLELHRVTCLYPQN